MIAPRSPSVPSPPGPGRRNLVRAVVFLGLLAACAATGMGVLALGGNAAADVGLASSERVTEASSSRLADPPAQTSGTQVAERMGPFEYTVNSVLGRSLNVPGTD